MHSAGVQVSWQDYLAVALRRKQCFLVPCCVSLVIGLLVALFAPRIYQAQALILVQSEKLINPLIQGLAMPTAISDRLDTLREEILSWSNLTQLIAIHKLDQRTPKNNPVALERLVQKLRQAITVKMRGETLIQVSYQGREPATVQQLVNSLTDIVIERDATIRKKEANTAVSFIEAEMAVYRTKLEESEHKLREFKELYMTQMPVATALNSQLKDLEVQLSRLLIDNTEEHPRVQEVRQKIEEVRKQRDDEIRRLVAKGVLEDKDPALYEELLNQLSAANQASEAAQVPAAGGTVGKAQEAYSALVEGLESPEVMPAIGSSQVAVTEEGTTIQLSDAAASSLTLAPRQQQELARLTRDYSVNESIYRHLLEKLERAKITGRLGDDEEGGKFTVIERARFPVKPIRPKPIQVCFVALMMGIMLGIGAVVLAEYLDQSIQSAEEATEVLGVPVLGSISTILTEADIEQRRQRRKAWFSWPDHLKRLKAYVVHPVWAQIDRLLVRWGI